MGRINIEKLDKTYANRRRDPRSDDDPLLRQGDRVTVLSDIDLNILDGEMVCFLGPSGCGKSTLLRIIAGFEPPSGGRVQINDKPVKGLPPTTYLCFSTAACSHG